MRWSRASCAVPTLGPVDLYLAVPVQMTSSDLAARLAEEIASGRWSDGEALPGVRKLARAVGCSPGTAARAYASLRDRGVLLGSPRSRFLVTAGGAALAARWGANHTGLRLAGSDDPALDLVVRAAGASVSVVPGPRGSVNGMVQLARGTADAAALHLLDVTSGRWNDPLARGALGGEPVELVHLWRREQGLVVQPGNPHGIRGVGDLKGLRIVWRPPGTGSRLLLERLMLAASLRAASGARRVGRVAFGGCGGGGDGRGRRRPRGSRGGGGRGTGLGAGGGRAVRARTRPGRPGRPPSRCSTRSPGRASRLDSPRCRATTCR